MTPGTSTPGTWNLLQCMCSHSKCPLCLCSCVHVVTYLLYSSVTRQSTEYIEACVLKATRLFQIEKAGFTKGTRFQIKHPVLIAPGCDKRIESMLKKNEVRFAEVQCLKYLFKKESQRSHSKDSESVVQSTVGSGLDFNKHLRLTQAKEQQYVLGSESSSFQASSVQPLASVSIPTEDLDPS